MSRDILITTLSIVDWLMFPNHINPLPVFPPRPVYFSIPGPAWNWQPGGAGSCRLCVVGQCTWLLMAPRGIILQISSERAHEILCERCHLLHQPAKCPAGSAVTQRPGTKSTRFTRARPVSGAQPATAASRAS